MIGSIRLWDIRASQAGFDNYNLEERDGESGIDCSDIKTGKAEDWMNTGDHWGLSWAGPLDLRAPLGVSIGYWGSPLALDGCAQTQH